MKTAIVTGGTRGIGLGIAKCLARDGYNLLLGYNSNHQAAEQTRETLQKEYGVQVYCCAGDIAVPETMEKLFEGVQTHFNNELTAFVHNAGLYVGITSGSNELQPKMTDDFDAVFEYYQKVYPRAFKRGLHLAVNCNGFRHAVAISSPGCNCNQPPQVTYEMPGQAKASMEFLVRLHGRILAKQGVTVNCVIPGLIETEAWDLIIEKTGKQSDMIKRLPEATPAGRWGQTSEIGEAVAFLCSSRAAFITGAVIPVDGGLHLTGMQNK
jgi:NAD(P)-dependent dehydrogenase (short-subunit alcohol dehydrogenase family)